MKVSNAALIREMTPDEIIQRAQFLQFLGIEVSNPFTVKNAEMELLKHEYYGLTGRQLEYDV